MSEPRRPNAVLDFFANALMAVGWLVVGLGGLCTLMIGTFGLGQGHTSLGDWMMPATMLAIGGGLVGLGLAVRRLRFGKKPEPGP